MRGPKKKPTPAGERTPAWARRWCERGSSSDGSEGAIESTVPVMRARVRVRVRVTARYGVTSSSGVTTTTTELRVRAKVGVVRARA